MIFGGGREGACQRVAADAVQFGLLEEPHWDREVPHSSSLLFRHTTWSKLEPHHVVSNLILGFCDEHTLLLLWLTANARSYIETGHPVSISMHIDIYARHDAPGMIRTMSCRGTSGVTANREEAQHRSHLTRQHMKHLISKLARSSQPLKNGYLQLDEHVIVVPNIFANQNTCHS